MITYSKWDLFKTSWDILVMYLTSRVCSILHICINSETYMKHKISKSFPYRTLKYIFYKCNTHTKLNQTMICPFLVSVSFSLFFSFLGGTKIIRIRKKTQWNSYSRSLIVVFVCIPDLNHLRWPTSVLFGRRNQTCLEFGSIWVIKKNLLILCDIAKLSIERIPLWFDQVEQNSCTHLDTHSN